MAPIIAKMAATPNKRSPSQKIEEVDNGGADRDRTDDLVIANDALSQLSYSPN
jgi:hypothetical protein